MASDEKVKEYAQRLVSDHKTVNKALAENAARLKMAVMAGLDKETRTRLDMFAKLKGHELDSEYMQCMVEDHEKAIKLFCDGEQIGATRT